MAASIYTAVVTAFVALALRTAAAAPETKACTCYRTSADDYFTNYQLHDFRFLGAARRIPRLQSFLPPSADDTTGLSENGVGSLQPGYISSDDWAEDWAIQDWGKGETKDTQYRMWNSLSNVFIDKNTDGNANATTKLVLRTKRFAGFQSTAEIENAQKNLLYASTRIRARVTGDPGAVAGLFYYRNEANESDIEILTRDDPNEIRYSNQPVVDQDGNEIENSSTKVDMNTNAKVDGTKLNDRRSLAVSGNDIKWSDWHTHRIDWVAGKSSWYIDGQHLLDKTYGVPTVPSYLVLNMWSDGGVWSGKMAEEGEARLEIEWIEIVYNTSGPIDASDESRMMTKFRREKGDNRCEVVCTVSDGEESGLVDGGYVPTISRASKRSTMWTGTDDREFIIATAIGATIAVVLYIVDTAL